MAWENVCTLSQLEGGKLLKVKLGDAPILLANVEGQVHAMSNACLHRGADLSLSEVEGSVITCHLHFWKYDLKDGHCLQVPGAVLKTYPVKVEEGAVFVEV